MLTKTLNKYSKVEFSLPLNFKLEIPNVKLGEEGRSIAENTIEESSSYLNIFHDIFDM